MVVLRVPFRFSSRTVIAGIHLRISCALQPNKTKPDYNKTCAIFLHYDIIIGIFKSIASLPPLSDVPWPLTQHYAPKTPSIFFNQVKTLRSKLPIGVKGRGGHVRGRRSLHTDKGEERRKKRISLKKGRKIR